MAESKKRNTEVACEQCRRRKSKCDRINPTCGACIEADSNCVFITQRPKRGPKKGQLRALRAHVAALEKKLAAQQNSGAPAISSPQETSSGLVLPRESNETDKTVVDPALGASSETGVPTNIDASLDESLINCADTMSVNANMDSASGSISWLDDLPTISGIPLSGTLPENIEISPGLPVRSFLQPPPTIILDEAVALPNLTKADLDALYFERVHPLIPIMHKGQFFTWADQKSPSAARHALHYAMWALASAVSTQFPDLGDRLYHAARQRLQDLEGSNDSLPWTICDVQLEQIQAWLLLAYYEFIRMERHHVLLTMGHTFRLVQSSRLHIVDASDSVADGDKTPHCFNNTGPDHNWITLEMKRRTFWQAFCFDRLLNAHEGLHFTLQEEVTCLRLPASEVSFESGRPYATSFLQEAIEESSTMLSSLAGCVVLVALYGRCLTHRGLVMMAALNGKEHGPEVSREFWKRHDWLAAAMEKMVQPVMEMEAYMWDPIASFCRFLSRSAIIHLSDTAVTWMYQCQEQRIKIQAYESRAYQAATEVKQLACALPRLSCLKTHPFLPSILSHTIVFLKRYEETYYKDDIEERETNNTEELLLSLEMFEDVHSSAKDLLTKIRDGTKHVF